MIEHTAGRNAVQAAPPLFSALLADLGGRAVTVQNAAAIRADSGDGRVGVQGNLPAPPVHRDQVVEAAQQ